MLCEVCRKNQANIYFTQVINGDVTKMRLCESCAEKKGIEGISFSEEIHSCLSNFALVKLLKGLMDLGIVSREEKLKCTNCGLSYQDFRQMGQLGCSECYKTFRANLIPLFERIHGKTEHMGRIPQRSGKISLKKELFFLQKELQKAIAKEEYERAAQLRDKIHAIDTKKENHNVL
jgi:protein arginine kinase activator